MIRSKYLLENVVCNIVFLSCDSVASFMAILRQFLTCILSFKISIGIPILNFLIKKDCFFSFFVLYQGLLMCKQSVILLVIEKRSNDS